MAKNRLIIRYKKILQIANTIIEELRLEHHFETPLIQSTEILDGYEVAEKYEGFENSLLYDTQKIPVTEDYTTLYTLKKKPQKITDTKLKYENGRIFVGDVEILFTRCDDGGDTYNYAPLSDYEYAKILGYKKLLTE